jgi:hypothetical protein
MGLLVICAAYSRIMLVGTVNTIVGRCRKLYHESRKNNFFLSIWLYLQGAQPKYNMPSVSCLIDILHRIRVLRSNWFLKKDKIIPINGLK